MSAGRIGCMTTPAQGSRIPEGVLYACDNSKFGSDGRGRYWPGAEAWFSWLERTVERYGPDRCLWALAPDQPFDAAGTLIESLPWLARIRELGIPAAYAGQDGCDVPGLLPWDAFDVLFLAGSTAWKLGPVAERLAREAKALGKGVHMGRVNSRIRLGIAEWFGCDSADGTYLAYGPDNSTSDRALLIQTAVRLLTAQGIGVNFRHAAPASAGPPTRPPTTTPGIQPTAGTPSPARR
ncbi:hypothetical protein [Streptomyces sp. NPDC059894]|uniref:hypothetical protein n=1 Tax=unclassified Streptomyces TaxID=2593676 RepID=UPI0036639991